jgi:CRP-like cAMP-binding protein
MQWIEVSGTAAPLLTLVFGELGLLTKGKSRTRTVVCECDGELLMIKYEEVRQMYYQSPEFGFFFLELVADRLFRDAKNKQRAEQKAILAST